MRHRQERERDEITGDAQWLLLLDGYLWKSADTAFFERVGEVSFFGCGWSIYFPLAYETSAISIPSLPRFSTGESKAYRRITADDMCTNCPYVPRISKNIDIAKCMYPFPTLTYHFFTTSSLAPLNRYYFIKNGRNTQTQQALRLSPIQLRQGIPSVPYDRPKGRYGTCPQIRYWHEKASFQGEGFGNGMGEVQLSILTYVCMK